jgi:alpha-1,3-rhamnosyl/mannosyltransferase
MNIVFDARVMQDHFPGIGRYAYNVLAKLPELLDDDETLTVLHDPSVKNTRYEMPVKSDRVTWVDYRTPIFGMKNVLTVPPIPNPKSALVHYPYYVRPRAARPPSVTTIYDAISFVYPEYALSAQARLSIRLLHQMAIAASRAIITISQSAANDLARFFPSARDKLIVTPLAPDPIFTPQPDEAITAIRTKFDLAQPFTLYLASNKPHKNLAKLIEAWKLVISNWLMSTGERPITNNQQPILIIAGYYDPRYPQAQQHVKALGLEQRVRFVGPVSDAEAAGLYSACALFVYPSLYEGFGLTPLEAMACGAPVACSNASSLPEVAGEAAVLFDPTRPEGIASACLRVLRDDALQQDMRSRSLAQAARFAWRETARLTMNTYREVNKVKSKK